ncbi:hypothetical protein [Haloarchaeobius salinus]|uniref:hypothetical protein n=1 Tax=Haloarchaeobius salinus TaxID=1198298 RepID=UPI00210B4183|nr:hypothetical protein [Haloarchaeobius salinus]
MQSDQAPYLDSDPDPLAVLSHLEAAIEHTAPEAFDRETDDVSASDRMAATGAVATTAAEHPIAASQCTPQLLTALTHVTTVTGAEASLTHGERQRLVRELSGALRDIATETPSAVYDHLTDLRTLLAADALEARAVAAEVLAQAADEYPAQFNHPDAVLRATLDDSLVSVQRHGTDIAAALCTEWPAEVSENLPKLIDLLDATDDDLRRKAANAIHELSIVTPSRVAEDTDALGAHLRDSDGRFRSLILLVFLEIAEIDHGSIWNYVDDLGWNLTQSHEIARERAGVLLYRLSIQSTEELPALVDILGTALEVETTESLSLPVQQLATNHPEPATELFDLLLQEATAEDWELDTREDFIIAAYWITEATDTVPAEETLEALKPLLSSEHAALRAAVALLYLEVHEVAPTKVENTLRAPDDTSTEDLTKLAWIDTAAFDEQATVPVLKQIQSQAESKVGEVDTTPPDTADLIEPRYNLAREENASAVLERALEAIHREDRTVLAEIEEVVSYLGRNSRVTQRVAIRVFYLASLKHPQQAARHLGEVLELTTSPFTQIRRYAVRVVLLLVDHNPKPVIENHEQFLEGVAHEDRLTRQAAAWVLIEISSRETSGLAAVVDQLIAAIETDYVLSSFVVEVVLADIVAANPESLQPHTGRLLEKLQLELRADPDEFETIESLVDPEITEAEDQMSLSLVPMQEFLDDQNRIGERPLMYVLLSLFLFDSSLIVKHSGGIRDLLGGSARDTKHGVWLIGLTARAGEPGVEEFVEDISTLLLTDDALDPVVTDELADCLVSVTEVIPAAFVPWLDELISRLLEIEETAATGAAHHDLVTALLRLISACLKEMNPERYPTPDRFLAFLKYDDEAGKHATSILGRLVETYPSEGVEAREAIVEWCASSQNTADLVGAVEFLTRTGSVSTLNETFHTTHES